MERRAALLLNFCFTGNTGALSSDCLHPHATGRGPAVRPVSLCNLVDLCPFPQVENIVFYSCHTAPPTRCRRPEHRSHSSRAPERNTVIIGALCKNPSAHNSFPSHLFCLYLKSQTSYFA